LGAESSIAGLKPHRLWLHFVASTFAVAISPKKLFRRPKIIICAGDKISVPMGGALVAQPKALQGVALREPKAADGPSVTALINGCTPLDPNSAYCHLIQCLHFAGTCVVAERVGEVIGWISAHRPPSAPEQIFVWQVAVHPSVRGMGLGARMLDALVARPAVQDARTLTATITRTNQGSWALFEGFARRRGLAVSKAPLFERETHFAGAHDTEWQASIDLFPPNPPASSKETT
jgi:L-2,4-diaminobutyric acid acetyltransferase